MKKLCFRGMTMGSSHTSMGSPASLANSARVHGRLGRRGKRPPPRCARPTPSTRNARRRFCPRCSSSDAVSHAPDPGHHTMAAAQCPVAQLHLRVRAFRSRSNDDLDQPAIGWLAVRGADRVRVSALRDRVPERFGRRPVLGAGRSLPSWLDTDVVNHRVRSPPSSGRCNNQSWPNPRCGPPIATISAAILLAAIYGMLSGRG